MRSLFFLLLVVNLSYLIWGVAFSGKNDSDAVVKQTHGDQTLTLLSEQADTMLASVNKSPAKTDKNAELKSEDDKNLSPSIGPAKTCYSLGPILDQADSKKLEQRLKKVGFTAKHKAITDKEPKSYWVYLPAEKTFEDAKALVDELNDAKIEDNFIIRKGKFNNSISLGLYNGFSSAKIRVRQLKKLGFNPKVQTRYKEVTRHWLDFQESDQKRLKTSVWEKVQKDNPLQKLARPCIDSTAKKAPQESSKKAKEKNSTAKKG